MVSGSWRLFNPPAPKWRQGRPVQTPFGRAPLTFADLVDKVKPAVVSVSVVNDGGASKLAENDKDSKKGGGLTIPDLPPDHPLHDFFKHLPKEFGQEEGRRPKMIVKLRWTFTR